MKRSHFLFRGILVLPVVMTGALLVRAAGEGGSAGEQSAGTAFKWVHFAILAILGYWLFTKVLPPVFRHKADSISAAIAKSTAAKAEAEKLLKAAVAKLESLEQEVVQFRSQSQREAMSELERLRFMTAGEVEKISAAAKAEIEAVERAARVELKAVAAKLAVDRAESLVAKELTAAVQEALIHHFVQNLQERAN